MSANEINSRQPAPSAAGVPAALTSRRTALVMVAIALCMFSQGFSLFKLLPMQSAIMDFFSIEVGAYGYLNTAQSWLLIFLSVPIGFLVRRLPSKWSVSLAFCVLLCGAAIQVTARSFVLFIIGRMLEGVGYSILSLACNSLMINLVEPSRVGFWASFLIVMAMLAQIVHTRVGTWMMSTKGLPLQAVLLAVACVQLACLLFWLAVVPASVRVTGRANAAKPTKEQTMRVYRNPSVWCVGIANLCFSLAMLSFNSYVIRFLVQRGMEPNRASTTFSYTTMISVFSMLFFGWLSGKLGTKRKIVIFSFFSGVPTLLLLAFLPIDAIFIYVIVYGTLPRSIAGLGSAAAHDLAELPADVPIVNSLKETINHVGTVVGGIATGYLLQYFGYYVTIYVLCGLMAVGGILWIFAKKVP